MVAFLSSVLAPRPLYPEYPHMRNPIGVDALERGLGGAIFPVGALLVLAGLVVAAFQLLRRRVRPRSERRFNRRRYDAARTVDHFAARLRDQIDLQALHGELLAVVDQTVQPAQASLWLRNHGT